MQKNKFFFFSYALALFTVIMPQPLVASSFGLAAEKELEKISPQKLARHIKKLNGKNIKHLFNTIKKGETEVNTIAIIITGIGLLCTMDGALKVLSGIYHMDKDTKKETKKVIQGASLMILGLLLYNEFSEHVITGRRLLPA